VGRALQFFREIEPLGDPRVFAGLLAFSKGRKWVVYAKPPFGGPAHVLKYLGRYTHRVAINNQRLLALEDGHVSFAWPDFRDSLRRAVTVSAPGFIRASSCSTAPPTVPSGFVTTASWPTAIVPPSSISDGNCPCERLGSPLYPRFNPLA